MDFGSAVVADEQPFELVQPGEGALDDPAIAAQAGAVRGAATGDLGFDAAAAQFAPVLVVVVAAVSVNRCGRRRGRPTRPRTGGTRSSSGISWVTS